MQRTQILFQSLRMPTNHSFTWSLRLHSTNATLSYYRSSLCASNNLKWFPQADRGGSSLRRTPWRGQARRASALAYNVSDEKELQNKTPWHREGSDLPPVARQRSAGAMTKGEYLVRVISILADGFPQGNYSQPLPAFLS